MGNGDVSAEHKWFIEGLQKGFAKKVRSEEQEAFAELLAREAAAEAALSRCREELRVGAEQRAALEEVLTASQASRDEMTQMVAQVAEVKQRMTEEMTQQALDVGMELRLFARDAMSGSLGDRHFAEPQDRLVDDVAEIARVDEAADGEEEQEQGSVCLLAGSPIDDDGEAFVTFRDVQLPLYSEACLQSFPSERLRRHALRLRATLAELLENQRIPEARNDIVLWILGVQQEHLEILPELEKLIRAAELQFDPHHDSHANGSTPSSPLGAQLRCEKESSNSKALSSSFQPVTDALAASSPSVDRSDLSRAKQNSSMVSTPESKTRPTSPIASTSPALVNRSSPAPSVRLSATRTSPATSMRSETSPCGSARKLSDNAIRTLPAPLANLARDNTVSLKLADRLGTGSPPLGPVRLSAGGLQGSSQGERGRM